MCNLLLSTQWYSIPPFILAVLQPEILSKKRHERRRAEWLPSVWLESKRHPLCSTFAVQLCVAAAVAMFSLLYSNRLVHLNERASFAGRQPVWSQSCGRCCCDTGLVIQKTQHLSHRPEQHNPVSTLVFNGAKFVAEKNLASAVNLPETGAGGLVSVVLEGKSYYFCIFYILKFQCSFQFLIFFFNKRSKIE